MIKKIGVLTSGGDAEDMRTYADLLDKVEAVLLPAYA
ncbi:hypothetical protein EC971742_4722, partial [Escherichia coli 97.1742]